MQPRTADEFLDLACLTHTENDAVERREQAEAILAASPGLAQEDAYVAAALGDVSALREHLDCDADLATRRGGPRDWDALLYVCNARIAPRASWDPLASARLLLDRGADARTHALMYQVPYTAITGAIGVGKTHLENALLLGYNLISKMLVDCGAAPPSLSSGEELRVACLRGREEQVRKLASAT